MHSLSVRAAVALTAVLAATVGGAPALPAAATTPAVAEPPTSAAPAVFYSRAGGAGTLWAAGGGADTQVGVGTWPKVSPDRRYLAFHRGNDTADPGRRNIWVRDLATGEEWLAFANNDWAVYYEWSSDSRRLMFDYFCSMWSMNADGSDRRLLWGAGDCYDDAPAINRIDGTYAFHNHRPGGGGIGLINADLTGRRFIPNTLNGDHWPAWSPDGQWISFLRAGDYYKIRPDGSGLTRLSTVGEGGALGPAGPWTADGHWLLAPGRIDGRDGIWAVSTAGDGEVAPVPISDGAAPDFVGSAGGETPLPHVSVDDPGVTEGNTGMTPATFTIALSAASTGTVTVAYATADRTATAPSDYVAVSGTVTFLPGDTSQTVTVDVVGEANFEPDETFSLDLSNPHGATLATTHGVGTIRNDDAPPNNAPVATNTSASTAEDTPVDITLTATDADGDPLSFLTTPPQHGAVIGLGADQVRYIPAPDHNGADSFTFKANDGQADSNTATLSITVSSVVDQLGPGDIYVADRGERANQIGPGLVVGIKATTGGQEIVSSAGALVDTTGIALASQGQMYVVDPGAANGTGTVIAIDTATGAQTTVSSGGSFATLQAVVAGPAGELYVADSNAFSGPGGIIQVDPATGAQSTLSSGGRFSGPVDLVVSGGDLLVADAFTSEIVRVNRTTGAQSLVATVSGSPAGLALDGNGDILVVGSRSVLRVDPATGAQSTVASGGSFASLNRIAVAESGAIYVTDALGVLFRVDPRTGAQTMLSRGGALRLPVALTVLTAPTLVIDDGQIDEGDTATAAAALNVTLSRPSTHTVTVDYATANGTATAGTDYTATSGTLTFQPGQTSKAVLVPIGGDTDVEPNETFTITLTNASGAVIADGSATVTIRNNDQPVGIIIDDGQIVEGDTASSAAALNVTLSQGSAGTITVDYATADGTATAGTDYTATSGTLTFQPGQTSKAVLVSIGGDTDVEPHETFAINLTNARGGGAVIADGSATVTIRNNDQPFIALGDVDVVEGDAGTQSLVFTVSASAPGTDPIEFTAATADGTATAGSDYTGLGATYRLPAGQRSTTIAVEVLGDGLHEPDETFTLDLSGVSGATLADGQGVGTIRNDDPTPIVIIDNVDVAEGAAGTTTNVTFAVSLTSPSASTVTVDYTTTDGTAIDGSDYSGAAGTLTFAPGDTTETITAFVHGDAAVEPDETFTVDLSNATNAAMGLGQAVGTIRNDDAVAISIADASTVEGDTQNSTVLFELTLSQALPQAVTVDYTTTDGTATGNVDYASATGTATFPAGLTTTWIGITVAGDTSFENHETFFLDLSNATNAVITDGRAVGTITDDDGAALLITPLDETGAAVVGTCFGVYAGNNGLLTSACDSQDGSSDGQITTNRVQANLVWGVRPTSVPSNYYKTPFGTLVSIPSGQTAMVAVSPPVHHAATLVVRTVNEIGSGGLSGCHYTGYWGNQRILDKNACGFGATVPAGTALGVSQTTPPSGYLGTADQSVTLASGQTGTVTFTNQPRLKITPLDETGAAVVGTCFEILDSGGTVLTTACDANDGSNDGRIVPLVNLTAGNYSLRPTSAPSGYFLGPFATSFTIPNNQTSTVALTPTIQRSATLVVETLDEFGQPLDGACYTIWWGSDAIADSGGSCLAGFNADVPAGVQLTVTQDVPPPGYRTLPSRAVTIGAAQTATVTFSYERRPRP